MDRVVRDHILQSSVQSWERYRGSCESVSSAGVAAEAVIYAAFVEGKLEAPRPPARTVHDLCFEREYEEFRSWTIWSRSNAFTLALKELKSILQFKATAKLGEFLEYPLSRAF